MSVAVTCDHCRKPIEEVAYVLAAVDAERIDLFRAITRNHLHWDCVPLFGRSKATKGQQ
jgi:hypothetical protein